MRGGSKRGILDVELKIHMYEYSSEIYIVREKDGEILYCANLNRSISSKRFKVLVPF